MSPVSPDETESMPYRPHPRRTVPGGPSPGLVATRILGQSTASAVPAGGRQRLDGFFEGARGERRRACQPTGHRGHRRRTARCGVLTGSGRHLRRPLPLPEREDRVAADLPHDRGVDLPRRRRAQKQPPRALELAALECHLNAPAVDAAAILRHAGQDGREIVGLAPLVTQLAHDRGRAVHVSDGVRRVVPPRVQAVAQHLEGRQGFVPAAEPEQRRHPPRLRVHPARVLDLTLDRICIPDRTLVLAELPALPGPHGMEVDQLEVIGEPVAQLPTPAPDLHRRAVIAAGAVGRRGRVVASRSEVGVVEAQSDLDGLEPKPHVLLGRCGRVVGKGKRPGSADRQQVCTFPAVAGVLPVEDRDRAAPVPRARGPRCSSSRASASAGRTRAR